MIEKYAPGREVTVYKVIVFEPVISMAALWADGPPRAELMSQESPYC